MTSRNVYATRARDEVGGSAIIPMVKEALRMPEQMTHAHMGYIRAITSLIRNIAHAPSKFSFMISVSFFHSKNMTFYQFKFKVRKNSSLKSISWKRYVFYFKMLIDIMTPQIILSKNMI